MNNEFKITYSHGYYDYTARFSREYFEDSEEYGHLSIEDIMRQMLLMLDNNLSTATKCAYNSKLCCMYYYHFTIDFITSSQKREIRIEIEKIPDEDRK